MQLLSKFNNGIRFLLCVIDIYSKYAWVIPLKDKKRITIINGFPKTFDESGRKPNKKWVDKGSEFYNRAMKSCSQDNNIEMYLTHYEVKTIIAERLIRILKIKIYKYISLVSKTVYLDKLDDIVNKDNNTNHSTIKMKPVDIKRSIYIDSSKENDKKDLKFKIVGIVRISKLV